MINETKKELWGQIANSFNQNFKSERTTQSLKDKWEKLKETS